VFGIVGVWDGVLWRWRGWYWVCSFARSGIDETDDRPKGKELYDHECDEMESMRLMVACFRIGVLWVVVLGHTSGLFLEL
jgi:hypothetical protein